MQELERKNFKANKDFVLSDGSNEIMFINEKVKGAYAIKSMATRDILATINALNGNVHSPSSFFHRSPEKNEGMGIDFALQAAVYLGLIKERRYLDAYPVDKDTLAKVGFCYGREYDPKAAIPLTEIKESLD